MHRTRIAFLALFATFLASTVSHAAYLLSEFSIAGATDTALWDINNHGAMVGFSVNGSGVSTGFSRASDGTITTLPGPAGAVSSVATGVSDGGVVVGSFGSAGDSGVFSQGFIYQSGAYSVLTVAGASDTFLRGVSPDGRYFSGYYTTATLLGVGFVYDSLTSTLQTVSRPESIKTIAQGINDSGILVGGDLVGGTPAMQVGFRYDVGTGTRTDVEVPGADGTALRAIDENDVVAGWFTVAGGTHGFVGSTSTYEQIDFPGASATYVEGSNNARWLVGNWIDPEGGLHAFVATPVAAPSSLALAMAGLLALGWKNHRPVSAATG